MTETSTRKPMLKLIVATDIMGGIGKDNQIPWKCKADMMHFKKTTLGHIVIMGRKTYDSIGKALPGRTNIVISSGPPKTDAIVVKSLEDAIHKAIIIIENEPIHFNSDIYIIGGGQVYEKATGLVDQVIRTVILSAHDCDTFFNTKFYDPDKWNLEIKFLDPSLDDILLYIYTRIKHDN